MSLKSHIEVSLLADNQKGATASKQNAMSDTELELVAGAGQPITGNPDMTDPHLALQLEQLSQGLSTTPGGTFLIKSIKHAADGLTRKI